MTLLLGVVLGALGIVPSLWAVLTLMVRGRSKFFALSVGSAFVMHFFLTPRERRARESLLGLILEAALASVRSASALPVLPGLGVGLGSYAVIARFIAWVRSEPGQRPLHARALFDVFAFTVFAILSQPLLNLTNVLRPTVFDPFVYVAEEGLGFQPSMTMKTVFDALPPVAMFASSIYLALPIGLALVHALKQERSPGGSPTVLTSFFLIGVVGYVFYFLFPVIGPVYIRGAFPLGFNPLEQLPDRAILGPPNIPRNCMPSLHTAWVLALFFQTRGLSRWTRILAALWVFATLLATLGLELHYLIDLIVAVPFAVAVDAYSYHVSPDAARERTRIAGAGVIVVVLWLLALGYASRVFAANVLATWGAGLGTVALGVLLRRRVTQCLDRSTWAVSSMPAEAARLKAHWSVWGVGTAFVLSGVAAMLYEVVFAKALAMTFGSTSLAQTTVLATYMGGIGLGSFLGARWIETRSDPLRIYALCELGIAAWCLLAPFILHLSQAIYLGLARNSDPSEPRTIFWQVLAGALVLLVPTTLMGVTTPTLAQHFVQRKSDLGGAIRLLYSANTLGAGLGALLTGYAILPSLGVRHSFFVAVVANCSAALLALRLRARSTPAARRERDEMLVEAGVVSVEEPVSAGQRRAGAAAIVILGVGGIVSLALEVVYVHLLAVVAGTSVYAFSLMLATFLVGLGAGSSFGNRFKNDGTLGPILRFQALLALSILAGVYAWDALPEYFASYSGYGRARTFAERELIRGIVCVLAMFPTAFFIGAGYPTAMAQAVRAFPRRAVSVFGLAAALNTVGNIAGALGAHFVLLPHLGSLNSLYLLALVSLMLSVVPLAARACKPRRDVVLAAVAGALLLTVRPESFDLSRLASGANVYFSRQPYGRVVDYAESSDGGLTTVAESQDRTGTRVLALMTNGKFQGDDSVNREVPAQYAFALCPLLHTRARGSALVIGYGTGTSARAFHDAGFQRVDVAELAEDILTLANKHFASVNGNVTSQPNVRSFVTDGRNFLLLRDETYDVVSMEISSIWFAGAASLYNREFYKLVSRRLNDRGVLQQWLQLHHLSPRDIASVLASVRSEFESVWLYFVQTQGVIVACRHDCPQLPEAVAMIDGVKAFEVPLRHFGGSAATLKTFVLLDPKGTDAFLEEAVKHFNEGSRDGLVSTDDNLKLEFSTPRGNVEEYERSLRRNIGLLETFRPKAEMPN